MHVSTGSLVNNVQRKFSRAILTLFDISATELYPGMAHEGQFKVADNDLSFNASVSLGHDNLPEYTFSAGLALGLNDALMALAATPRFITDVPLDHDMVNRHIVHPKHNFSNYSYIKEQPLSYKGQSLLLPLMTSDPRRLALGDALFALTGQIMVLHQAAHFLNGHYFYEKSRYERNIFHEFSEAPTRSIEELADRRAMELDADAYSATVLLHRYLQIDFQQNIAKIATPFGQNHEGWLRLVAASYMIFFCLYALGGDSNDTDIPEEGRAHPGPEGRYVHLLSVLKMVYQQRWKQPLDNDSPIVKAMLGDATAIMTALGYKATEELGIDINPERGYIRGLQQCIAHRRKITPVLARYSRKACAKMGTVSIHSGSLG